MPKPAAKRRRKAVLHVMTLPALLATWRKRARESNMSLREWVERTLRDAPVIRLEEVREAAS